MGKIIMLNASLSRLIQFLLSRHSRFGSITLTILLSFTMLLVSIIELKAQEVINPRTGRLFLEVIDLAVPAGPISLPVKRAFRHWDAPSSLLGARWLLNWESRLFHSGQEVVILDWNRPMVFQREDESGDFKSFFGESLIFYEDGTAVCIHRDGQMAVYDMMGRLIKKKDPNGNTVALMYDTDGHLNRIEGPRGIYLEVTTDDRGRVILVEASTGAKVKYGYGRENLVEVEVNGGPPIQYGYDEEDSLVSIERPITGTVMLSYDAKGRVTVRRWADGSEEFYEYDDDTNTRRHISPTGGVTTFVLGKDGNREDITDPLGNKSVTEYNDAGQPISITSPTGDISRFTYDSLGRAISTKNFRGEVTQYKFMGETNLPDTVTYPNGSKKNFEYDKCRNLTAIKEKKETIIAFDYYQDGLIASAKGKSIPEHKFSYYPNGRLKLETDVLGRTTQFKWDEHGNLIRQISPDGGVMEWLYDSRNRVVSWTDPAGATIKYTYDKQGRLIIETDPNGGVTRYEYDTRGRQISETDPLGRTTRYKYGADDQPLSFTDASNQTFRYEYDPAGNLVRVVNPLGGLFKYEYDAMGRLAAQTDWSGRVWRYQYSKDGLSFGVTDPTGERTQVKYDADGRAITDVLPGGISLNYSYDDQGRLKSASPIGSGISISYEYDPLGRLSKKTYSTGLQIGYQYDTMDNLISRQDNLGTKSTMEYNQLGLLTKLIDSMGEVIRYRYNHARQLIEEIDPLGQVKRISYNDAGDLTEVKGPLGNMAKIEYDDSGRLSVIHYPGRGVSRLIYDDLGNIVETTDPLGLKKRYSYNQAGRLVKMVDGNGRMTTYIYNSAGRLVQKGFSDGKTVSYKYDTSGYLVEVDDGDFPVRYGYDQAGRINSLEYPAIKRTLHYEYDSDSRLMKFIDSEGSEISYEYDQHGRFSAIATPGGAKIAFIYDTKNRLTSITYPNGVKGIREYDALDRTVKITYTDKAGKIIKGSTYNYDAAGNPIKIVDSSGMETSYQYDKSGQLTEEADPSAKVSYSYLPGGNRGKLKNKFRAIEYKYNKADQLLRAGDERFRYDKDGNLIERRGPKGATRYCYDARNLLVKVVSPEGVEVSFGYAPTGERIWRKDKSGTTWFVTDGMNLLAELGEDLKPKATYLHGPGIDQPLMMWKDGNVFQFHTDILGSVAALTDANGNISASYLTDAFGNVKEKKGRSSNPFILTARYYESNLGLYYYRARYYDPTLGRFLSKDLLTGSTSQPAWLNRYAYTRNAPTRYVDPLGLDVISNLPASELKVPGFHHLLVRWLVRMQYKIEQMQAILNRKEVEILTQEALGGRHPGLSPGYHLMPTDPTDPSLIEWAIRKVKSDLETWGSTKLTVRHIKSKMAEVWKGLAKKGVKLGIDDINQIDFEAQVMKETMRSGRVSPSSRNPSQPSGGAPEPPAGAGGQGVPGVGSELPSGGVSPSGRTLKWNPNYEGPPDMNDPMAQGHLKKLPDPKGSTSTIGEPSSFAERFATPIITLALTTDMIIECKNDKLNAEQCAHRLLEAAAWAAGIKLGLLLAPSATPVVAVAGVGAMAIKGVYDGVRTIYEGGSWAGAELERWKVEREREEWTEENLHKRLDKDLHKLRERIDKTLNPISVKFVEKCLTLDEIVSDTTKYGNEAENLMEQLPSAEVLKTITSSEVNLARVPGIQAEIETIRDNIQGWSEKVKTGLDWAGTNAQSCSSKVTAEAIRGKYNDAAVVLKAIQERAARARSLDQELTQIAAEVNQVKGICDETQRIKDRIGSLRSKMASYETLKRAIDEAQSPKNALMTTGGELIGQINGLMMAYPDNIRADLEYRFFELKKLVMSYQYRTKCDPQSYLSKYNVGAGKVTNASLSVENRLSGLDINLISDLSRFDRGAVKNALKTIDEAEREAISIVATNADLPEKVTECLANLTSGDKENEGSGGFSFAGEGRTLTGDDQQQAGSDEKEDEVSGGFSFAGEGRTITGDDERQVVDSDEKDEEESGGFSFAGEGETRTGDRPLSIRPASIQGSGPSAYHIFAAASSLGWAGGLSRYSVGPADQTIIEHLGTAGEHARAAYDTSFEPTRAWPNWQSIQGNFRSWGQQLARSQNTGYRAQLATILEGSYGSMAEQLGFQTVGETKRATNCDDSYCRLGYLMAYGQQALQIAEGAASVGDTSLRDKAQQDGIAHLGQAIKVLGNIEKVVLASGYCVDLRDVKQQLVSILQRGRLSDRVHKATIAWETALERIRSQEPRRGREAPQEIVKPEKETNGHCHELEGLFWAAIDADNLSHAWFVLEEAKDCPFYGKAMEILQDRENLLCMKFESAILSACLDQDLERAQGLLQEARSWGCLISQRTHNLLQEQMAFRQRQQEQSELARNRRQAWNQFWNDLQMWQRELMQGMQQPQPVDRDEKPPPVIPRKPTQQDTGLLAGDWEQHGNYFVIRISRQGMLYVGQMVERYPKKTKPYGYLQGETVLKVEFVEGTKYIGKYKALINDKRKQRTVKNWAQAEVHYSTQYDQFSVSYRNEVTAANLSGGNGHQDFKRYKPVSKGKSHHNTGFK